MKRIFTILAVLLMANVFAQTPERMSYQAVVRNSSDALVKNTTVGIQISILQGSANGTAVYVETQTLSTNMNGLISLEIGNGTVQNGDFSSVDWANGPYFLKTETDPEGGANYTITGTSQLLSVPYSLHAKTADEAQTVNYNNITDKPINVSQFTNDAGYLTINDNIDVDPTNEIQDLQLENNTLTITNNTNATSVDLSSYLDDTDTHLSEEEVDAMVSNNGFITSPDDADADPTNEIQNLSSVLAQGNDSGAKQIKNILDPTEAQDATTKAYVDALKSRIKAMEDILVDEGLYKVTDVDGNAYNVVKIGSQLWLKENLKTTKYNDGTEIPLVTDQTEWGNLTTPGYCWLDNDQSTYGSTYGALYNWYTVATEKLCPTGWHVPSDEEWSTMENYLIANGYNYDGTTHGDRDTNNKIAKALASTTDWFLGSNVDGSPSNTGYPEYRNKSGFTALPASYRYINSFPPVRGFSGLWWTKTKSEDSSWAWTRNISHYEINMHRGGYPLLSGMSVRCLKD